jgi:trans-aconitate methyltransferase
MKWNSNLYDEKHAFVSKYGEDVIELLNPQHGERILDVGCGTGDLARQIRESGAEVIGIDSSSEMVHAAKKKYPSLHFEVQSAENIHFKDPFDAVFSNATLHWVPDAEKTVQSIYQSLKPNGRFIAEFGGKGNVSIIIEALKDRLLHYGFYEQANKTVWYFPSLSEYTSLLEANGFRVVFAAHFDRPTELKDQNGIQDWLRMFAASYFQNMHLETVRMITKDVEEQIRSTQYQNGKWYADYKRLRVKAIKEGHIS